jgi:hypothetical protein
MKDLSTGSIPGHIASMSIQMAIGILVQTLYFFTDLYFVSKLGDQAIAGVTSAGNVWFIVLALTQILNVGTVALVSHAVGAQAAGSRQPRVQPGAVAVARHGRRRVRGVLPVLRPYMHTVAADDATARAGSTTCMVRARTRAAVPDGCNVRDAARHRHDEADHDPAGHHGVREHRARADPDRRLG